jgi:hypothetical protein
MCRALLLSSKRFVAVHLLISSGEGKILQAREHSTASSRESHAYKRSNSQTHVVHNHVKGLFKTCSVDFSGIVTLWAHLPR